MKPVNDNHFDGWLTDPADCEWCPEHERVKPCRVCRQEAAEYRSEMEREERDDRGINVTEWIITQSQLERG